MLGKDDLIWQKLEDDSDAWYESVRTPETCREVGSFMLKYNEDGYQAYQPIRRVDITSISRRDVTCDKDVGGR